MKNFFKSIYALENIEPRVLLAQSATESETLTCALVDGTLDDAPNNLYEIWEDFIPEWPSMEDVVEKGASLWPFEASKENKDATTCPMGNFSFSEIPNAFIEYKNEASNAIHEYMRSYALPVAAAMANGLHQGSIQGAEAMCHAGSVLGPLAVDALSSSAEWTLWSAEYLRYAAGQTLDVSLEATAWTASKTIDLKNYMGETILKHTKDHLLQTAGMVLDATVSTSGMVLDAATTFIDSYGFQPTKAYLNYHLCEHPHETVARAVPTLLGVASLFIFHEFLYGIKIYESELVLSNGIAWAMNTLMNAVYASEKGLDAYAVTSTGIISGGVASAAALLGAPLPFPAMFHAALAQGHLDYTKETPLVKLGQSMDKQGPEVAWASYMENATFETHWEMATSALVTPLTHLLSGTIHGMNALSKVIPNAGNIFVTHLMTGAFAETTPYWPTIHHLKMA
jgi:hypothetical protein